MRCHNCGIAWTWGTYGAVWCEACWQRELLKVIITRGDRPPTIKEITVELGRATTSVVDKHLWDLQKAGLITNDRNGSARTMRVTAAGVAAFEADGVYVVVDRKLFVRIPREDVPGGIPWLAEESVRCYMRGRTIVVEAL